MPQLQRKLDFVRPFRLDILQLEFDFHEQLITIMCTQNIIKDYQTIQCSTVLHSSIFHLLLLIKRS